MKRKIITTLLVISMLIGLCASVLTGAATTTYPFTDVPSWASEYVQIVYEKTIMKGTGGNNFGTNAAFTREQMVTTLYNMAKANVTASNEDLAAVFADGAKVSSWARPAVKWAVDNGITSGIKEGGKLYFKPQKALTRAEAAAFIVSYLNYSKLPTSGDIKKTFEDEDSLSWAKTSVMGCVGLGIINGIPENGALYFKPAQTLTRIEAAVMLAFTSQVEPEKPAEPEKTPVVSLDPKDPSPENIGETNYGSLTIADGLKVSNAMLVDDAALGNAFTATGFGNHGWVESRVVRNEYGTYIVMAVNEEMRKTGTYNANGITYNYGIVESTFYLLKTTSDGFTKVYEGKYDLPHGGSCAPNVLSGENGKIYITAFTVHGETYFGSNLARAAACLDVHEFDTKTNTLVTHTRDIIPFKEGPSYNQGYYQPAIDLKQGKIYALFAAAGNSAANYDGCISWFIYDIKTHTWEPTNYTARTPSMVARAAYFHIYPDGKGGVYFLAERDMHPRDLEQHYARYGIAGIKFGTDIYIWDTVHLLSIPDMHNESINLVDTVFLPDYTNMRKFPRDAQGQINPAGASHYTGGTSYMDSSGYLHVIVQSSGNPYSYSVYDTNDGYKRIRRGNLSLMGSEGYQFAITESSFGEIYIVAVAGNSTTTTLEVYSIDFLSNQTVAASMTSLITDANGKKAALTVTYADGTTFNSGRLSYTGTRNLSIQDNTICLLTSSGAATRKTSMKNVDMTPYSSGKGHCDWSGAITTTEWTMFSVTLPD